jgi:hypothetical protein
MKLRRFLTILHEEARLPEPTKPSFAILETIVPPAIEPNRSPWLKRFVLAFSLVFLAAVGYAGYRMNVDPVATVSVDFNPSLEFQVNRFGRVVGATSDHPVGEALIEQVAFRRLSIEDAVQATYEKALELGYLNETNLQYFLVGIASTDAQKELSYATRIHEATDDEHLRLMILTRHSSNRDAWFGIDAQTLSPAFDGLPSTEDAAAAGGDQKIDSIYDIQTPLELLTPVELASLSQTLDISQAKLAIVVLILVRENQTTNPARLIQLSNTDINQLVQLYQR